MNYQKTLVIACNLALLTTGAIAQPKTLDPVGPETETLQPSDYVGTLKVYTATEQRPDGDETYRYPHTDYEIYKADGKRLEKVDNGMDQLDETPTAVTLPRGRYTVEAESETNGFVRVPVVIQTGRTTVVNLEQDQTPRGHVEVGAITE
jgi:hypothetical protein